MRSLKCKEKGKSRIRERWRISRRGEGKQVFGGEVGARQKRRGENNRSGREVAGVEERTAKSDVEQKKVKEERSKR